MKISVCIPVYNFDVRELVNSLKKEIRNTKLDAEIILIDDASTKDFVKVNKSLKEVANLFIFLKKNIGRSAIRNLFLKYASGDFLLFLDCDAKIISEKFLKNYLQFIKENKESKVVFGGFEVEQGALTLRKKYSLEREIVPLEKRKLAPYSSFRGINFLVKKEILQQFPFDENLKTYGYEDLIFSKKLEQKKVFIHQIENPVLHSDEETTDIFLSKTKIAIQNLRKIHKNNPDFVEDMKLIKVYQKIKDKRLLSVYKNFFKISKSFLINKLYQENPNLRYFDLYKLGLFIEKHN
jgi:glycosyltransferase involved in cell wall biosynthesis